MQLKALYPDTSVEDVLMNTGFKPRLATKIEIIPPPERSIVEFIRRLDPLKVHEKEIRTEDMRRGFSIA
jgi:glutaconate CoA-transferase, subunit B